MNPIVIKLGGAAGVDAEAVLADVAALAAQGQAVVLVHGTLAVADALAQRVGVPVRHITSPSGHVSRYTDPEALELYVAAAAGQVNKSLVASLQKLGCNAVGLSGVDGRLLVARRKDAVRAVENGRQRIIRDDYTGQLESANGDLLRLLLVSGFTPVIAPLALGLGGRASERGRRPGRGAGRGHAGRVGAGAAEQRAGLAGELPGREQPGSPVTAGAIGPRRRDGPGPHEEENSGRPRGVGCRRERRHHRRFASAPTDSRRAGRRGDDDWEWYIGR